MGRLICQPGRMPLHPHDAHLPAANVGRCLQVSAGCLPDDKAAAEVCRKLAKMLGNPVRTAPKDAFRALIGDLLQTAQFSIKLS